MAEETAIPEPEIIKISVFTPLIYVGVVLSVFVAFSIIYRRRRLNTLRQTEPLFKENYNAILYQNLKEQYHNQNIPKDQRPHEKVLKAALLRRAVEAIRRSMKLKECESIFNKLYQNGLIGDEIFKQYEIQLKFQELELKEIVQECESYKKGWVQTFFPVAQEICFNEALRRRLKAMEGREEALAELWQCFVEKTEPAKPKTKKTSPAPAVVNEKETTGENKASVEDTKEEVEEDEESDEEANNETQKTSTGQNKKKKKGKGKKK
ncbi:uncharacterized protein SPAPADRAFT_58834 [Spathaspora passalidarum NRRL Y-27907]|uniref:Translocation protein SEC66 n=1 Tax=Spathaspora passalidarum (strain NRRL Y-27907 / 11-Y1) TaxID=619300 RepID=G3AE86_SPAPN|nr:uncharacterized protein SPAPADRAFT_58834 [Spathaspora passalidarum NRRL Y-27907]EGW35620.1 hypothetical protein SPAPADRAFT_58834 [Spathaspora passalidarum NRRL Y-27907]